jgi:parallel beta-helix repeat protein
MATGNCNDAIRVGGNGADIAGYDSIAMQTAADALRSRGGGTILLSEGVYAMYGPVRLYSGMTLKGRGKGTVLKKAEGVVSAFAQDVDYGVLCARVADPAGFRAGTGIQVKDASSAAGYTVSTSKAVAVEGDTIYFDRRTIMDYVGENGGEISSACSVIEAIKADGVRICDLAVDGNGSRNPWIDGCRGGGIYLSKASRCTVENVLVHDFNGDGISWQITGDIAVRNTEVSGCAGSGLHPGTGTERSLVEGCRLIGNQGDGIFVCWRVCNCVFRNNEFSGNGANGICIGHRDTDNIFEGNVIRENRVSGVMTRIETEGNRADRNAYRRNTVEDNGGPEGGSGFLFLSAVRGNVIEENTIGDSGAKRQRTGISGDGLSGLTVRNNVFRGHALGDMLESGTNPV